MSKIVIKITPKVIKYEEVEINLCRFRCYDSGKVESQRQLMYGKKGDWCRCDNNKPFYNKNTNRYYIRVGVNGKNYYLHRIIYFAFNINLISTTRKSRLTISTGIQWTIGFHICEMPHLLKIVGTRKPRKITNLV